MWFTLKVVILGLAQISLFWKNLLHSDLTGEGKRKCIKKPKKRRQNLIGANPDVVP